MITRLIVATIPLAKFDPPRLLEPAPLNDRFFDV